MQKYSYRSLKMKAAIFSALLAASVTSGFAAESFEITIASGSVDRNVLLKYRNAEGRVIRKCIRYDATDRSVSIPRENNPEITLFVLFAQNPASDLASCGIMGTKYQLQTDAVPEETEQLQYNFKGALTDNAYRTVPLKIIEDFDRAGNRRAKKLEARQVQEKYPADDEKSE